MQVNARKERIASDAAWELLKDADTVFVAKGKKAMELSVDLESKEKILAIVIGPSGNLRAPTWKIENNFLVGFNAELYQKVFC